MNLAAAASQSVVKALPRRFEPVPLTLVSGEPYPVGLMLGAAPPPAPDEPLQVLVYCAGLAGSSAAVEAFLRELAPRYHALVGLDLRGFGRHQGQLEPQVQRFIPDVLEVLNALPALLDDDLAQWGRCNSLFNITLCGISLGGVVLTHVAHRVLHQQALRSTLSLKRLVLVAPAFEPHPAAFSAWFTVTHILKWLASPKTATMLLPYGPAQLCRRPLLVPSTFHQPVTLPMSLMLASRVQALKAAPLAKGLTCPVHVVAPLQDKICCPKAMRAFFQRLPHNGSATHRLTELPHAYHDALLDPDDYHPIFYNW
jgi:alpha-beta hydrolase superfamily lysophospholipase